jgi:hypothetical protein
MAGMPVSPPSVVVMQCAGVSDHVAATRLTGISCPPPQSAGRHRYGESGRGRVIDVSRTFLHQNILGVSPSRLPPQGASGARQGRVKALATGRTFLLLRGLSVTERLRLYGRPVGGRQGQRAPQTFPPGHERRHSAQMGSAMSKVGAAAARSSQAHREVR